MLNDSQQGSYLKALRAGGGNSGLGVFAQMGRYRSQAVAPNVSAQGARFQQAQLAQRGMVPPTQPMQAMAPMMSAAGNPLHQMRMNRVLADLGMRMMLGL